MTVFNHSFGEIPFTKSSSNWLNRRLLGQRHPHILLVVLDDAGFNDFDWMGDDRNQFKTPFLRGLTQKGVLLRHHYT